MWAKNQQNAQFDIKNRRKRGKKHRFGHKNAVKIRNNTFNSEHCLLLANFVRFCFTKNQCNKSQASLTWPGVGSDKTNKTRSQSYCRLQRADTI